MSSTFESIFETTEDDDTNTVDTSLKQLFKKRKQSNPNTDKILSTINELRTDAARMAKVDKESKPEVSLSRREKAKLKIEKETRTIFIGNLPKQTKKEVMHSSTRVF